MRDYAAELNPSQLEAATAPSGPLLILAGAGTGKTRVLTYRVAHLLDRGAPPYRVLAVTFTNKAAGEMRERLERLCGPQARSLWVGTFHATCAKLLRVHGRAVGVEPSFAIFDDDDQRRLVMRLMKEAGAVSRFTPRQVLSRIDERKNRSARPGDGREDDALDELVDRLQPEYQRALRRENALDFGDLLLFALELVSRSPAAGELQARFDEVLVDEFQDTNRVQYDLVRALATRTRSLAVVGDDDQAIYAWRGADVRNILDFERDFPDARVVKLEHNYRSTAFILSAANAVIANNVRRMEKALRTDRPGGEPLLLLASQDERHEAEQIGLAIARLREAEGRAPRDFAVLYRTHAQSRVLEEVLRAGRTPYVIVGGVAFYGRREVKDLLAYLRLATAAAPRDLDVERIINVPARGIGDGTVEKIQAIRRALPGEASLFDACRAATGEAAGLVAPLPAAARRRVSEFVALVDELRHEARTLRPAALARFVLERSGLEAAFAEDPSVEARERLENVHELVAALREFEERSPEGTLDGFLEQAALLSPADESASDAGGGQVTLMTIHAAKGLEFPVVLLCGLEEGLFPSARASEEADTLRALGAGEDDGVLPLASPLAFPLIEEERRLAYVAMTRARERLILTCASRRRIYDSYRDQEPSRFLSEIPPELMVVPRTVSPVQRRVAVAPPRPRRPAPPRRAPDEVWVDYEDGGQADVPGVGARVRHSRYGLGTVRDRSGEGGEARLRIDFAGVGEKTILARFVQPA